MNKSATDTPSDATVHSRCLVRAVDSVMRTEPALEAVKVNRSTRSISVATLGHAKDEALQRQLTAQLHQLELEEEAKRCGLLEGERDCTQCTTAPVDLQARRLTVDHGAETTTIARVTCPTAPKFWRWREFPWPKVVPRQVRLPEALEDEDEWKAQLAAAIVCGVSGATGYFLGAQGIGLTAFLVAYVAGAWFTVHEIWEGLKERTIDVHFLMLAVAAGSAAIGAWGEGAMLLFLFSFSGALEHYAMGRTQREIRSLFKSAPKEAHVIDEHGHESLQPVDALQPGFRVLIKPGEQFPVDAEIIKGETASDESNLTGEATPVDKRLGDTVMAGTLNLWGMVEAVVLRPASQSALQRIIHLIREAQHMKAPSQRFTDRFGTTYTLVILGMTLAMFFVWWLAAGHAPFVPDADGRSAFYLSMTLLVVASPCALVLSIPSAVLAAIAWGARRGILFRGGAAVENLAEVTVVAMDKTGTLTTGELQVQSVESYPPGHEASVAQLAYSLERLSTHPLARAVTRYGKQQRITPLELERFESIAGMGLQARCGDRDVALGRREWLASRLPAGALDPVPPTEPGFSEVWVVDGSMAGRLILRDDIRPQSRDVVLALRARGLRTVVLTGDRHAAAEHLRAELAVDAVHSELKPEQKVDVIRSLSQSGSLVAMVGDGVNDAPSLAAAHVGVAMGARGSDAALEQAEIVLMHDRLENFLTAYELSRRARKVIRQNLVVSLGTVVVLVGCALFASIPLTLGVLGHEGSTVIVVINSLRLLLTRQHPAVPVQDGASALPSVPN